MEFLSSLFERSIQLLPKVSGNDDAPLNSWLNFESKLSCALTEFACIYHQSPIIRNCSSVILSPSFLCTVPWNKTYVSIKPDSGFVAAHTHATNKSSSTQSNHTF